MTLIKPGGPQETWAPHAQLIRLAMSSFLSGAGVLSDTDFVTTGVAGSMNAQITSGIGFPTLKQPTDTGNFQGYGTYPSTATEFRSINAAPTSGTRNDILGIQVWSQEFGDDHDDWDLVIVAGTVGSSADPKPSPVTAAWLPLYRITVPKGATSGSGCTFTRLAAVTRPRRVGGFQSADLNIPDQFQSFSYSNVTVQDNGWVYAWHTLGEKPATITFVGTGPTGGNSQVPAQFLLDRTRLGTADYWVRVLRGDGSPLNAGDKIAFDATWYRKQT